MTASGNPGGVALALPRPSPSSRFPPSSSSAEEVVNQARAIPSITLPAAAPAAPPADRSPSVSSHIAYRASGHARRVTLGLFTCTSAYSCSLFVCCLRCPRPPLRARAAAAARQHAPLLLPCACTCSVWRARCTAPSKYKDNDSDTRSCNRAVS